MSSEKEIALRDWETLEDEQVVRSAATKGKFIHSCIRFLSERREISLIDARKYFYNTVLEYVERLINNRQIHKADHVLKNVGFLSKNVYFQISKEASDPELREYLVDYYKKNFEDFETDLMILEEEWFLFHELIIFKDFLLENFAENVPLTELDLTYFDNFCRIDRALKDQLITFIFFNKEAVQLAPHLNKYKVWDYLIEHEMIKDIKLWSNGRCQETNFTDLNGMLRILYQSWTVDQPMFRELQERMMFTESILYGFAQSGCFLPNESDNIQKVLDRIVTMEALDNNEKLLNSQGCQEFLLRFIVDKHLPSSIASGIFTKEFLLLKSEESNPFQNEIKAFLNIEQLFDENKTRDGMLQVSKALTEYVSQENSECPNSDLSELLEGILSDCSVEQIRPLLPDYFSHMRVFFDEAFSAPLDVDLNYLIKRYLNVDLKYLQTTTFEYDTNYLPKFDNTQCRGYEVYPHKLSYLHYIKQGRSSYAAYLFLIEQLRQYSKISTTHLLIAAQNVVELAMTNISDKNLTAHCIAFIENLGIDTMKVRALVRCIREIEKVDDNEVAGSLNINLIVEAMFDKVLVDNCTDALNLEAVGLIASSKSSTMFKDGICELLSKQTSWFKCLLLCQYLNLPTDQVHRIISMIPNVNLRNNLMLAIQYDKAEQIGRRNSRHFRRRRRTYTKQKSEQSNGKSLLNLTHILQNNDPSAFDLMGVILNVTDNIRLLTFTDFLNHILNPTPYHLSFVSFAWVKKWPIFVLMAAVKYDDVDQKFLWLLWLMISTAYDGSNLHTELGFNELAADVICHAVKNGLTETFSVCTKVFYPKSAFCFFAQFLEISKRDCRNVEAIDFLKRYLMVLHSDNLSPIAFEQRADALAFSAKILLQHIEHNFNTSFDRLSLLVQLCPLGHFDRYVDLELMRDIYGIIDGTGIEVAADVFTKEIDPEYSKSIFQGVCDRLKEQKLYEKAIQVAKIFDLSINQIMFEIWRRQLDHGDKTLTAEICENDVKTHDLNPEMLVEFYLSIVSTLDFENSRKYYWLRNALIIMQEYNLNLAGNYDFDQLETLLVLSYIKTENYSELPKYNSHFYRTIMTNENFVIYQTLTELKLVARVNEISQYSEPLTEEEEARYDDLIHQLLDESDIIQVLRYQAMFNRTTQDLRYVVLSMELAEGSASVYRISADERKTLNSDKIGASRLNRRTLLITRFSQSSVASSPRQASFLDTSNTSPEDFEEIPCREMQDTKDIIQNICNKVKHGIPICQRILQIYRIAMLMEQSYEIILKRKDPFSLLNDVTTGYCLNKILVINDIISASKMTAEEVADFLSHQLTECLTKARFYLLQSTPSTIKDTLWGFDLDTQFHLFLELCPNTTLFGNYLLCYYEALNIYRQPNIYTERKNPRLNLVISNIQCILQGQVLSQKKQNTIQIELLIKAHQCFLHECSVEGIAEVLQKSKALVNVLSNAKSWNLIIRLLTGIGRYKEMFYCFDILVVNEQFTQLIKKCAEERCHSLQSAIMSYIREQCSSNKHYFESAAAHFCMYKELAELYSNDADTIITTIVGSNMKKICIQPRNDKDPVMVSYINGTKAALTSLQTAMDYYSSSTELYLLDNKLSLAQLMVTKAEVIALQMCLINQGHSKYGSICILKPEKDPKLVTYLVHHVLSVPQSIVLLRGADMTTDWSRAIFEQFVMRNDEKYLVDFLDRLPFNETILDDIYKLYLLEGKKTNDMNKAMQKLISYHQCSAEKYKLSKV